MVSTTCDDTCIDCGRTTRYTPFILGDTLKFKVKFVPTTREENIYVFAGTVAGFFLLAGVGCGLALTANIAVEAYKVLRE